MFGGNKKTKEFEWQKNSAVCCTRSFGLGQDQESGFGPTLYSSTLTRSMISNFWHDHSIDIVYKDYAAWVMKINRHEINQVKILHFMMLLN